MIKTMELKLNKMRKPQKFVAYPTLRDGQIIIQSDNRIVKVDPATGAYTGHKSSGNYATVVHLTFPNFSGTLDGAQLRTVTECLSDQRIDNIHETGSASVVRLV